MRRSVIAWLVVASLTLALVWVLPVAHSNPIPAPTVILKHEYIYMTFRQGPGADGVTVTVTGIYPFENVGFKELDMYFPVPPEVISNGEAWVSVDGHPVKYEVVNEGEVYVPGGGTKTFKYDSVLGVLPMLKWHIKFNGSSRGFTVNVTYKYVLKPVEVEVPCNCSPSGKVGVMVHRTIYAMATGRFYYIYSKRVVADVTLRFIGPKFDYAPINISLVPAPSEMTNGYTKLVLPPGNANKTIKLVIGSDLFKGMRRDILIEFIIPRSMPTTTPPEGWGGTTHPSTTSTPTATSTNTGGVTSTVTTTLTKTVTVTAVTTTTEVTTVTTTTTTSLQPNSGGASGATFPYYPALIIAVAAVLAIVITAKVASRK